MFSYREVPAHAYIGEIIGVLNTKYTIDVRLDDGRIASDVSWLSPYSYLDGNGMYAMPQIGASVLIIEYSPGCFVVAGFIALKQMGTGDRRCSRRQLNLGDLCLQGSDQCYILLRRSSEHIILQTSPKCSIIMKNSDNMISVDVQRLRLAADGGIAAWDSDPKTLNTTFSWIFRDKAENENNTANLIIGFHPTEDDEAKDAGIDKSIISLIVNETVVENDKIKLIPKFKLIIGADGRILCSAESIFEVYKDFIDRYAGSFIKDVAEKDITRQSKEENIMDTASKKHISRATTIHHQREGL